MVPVRADIDQAVRQTDGRNGHLRALGWLDDARRIDH